MTKLLYMEDFAVPCGGTHVKDIKQIGQLNITNIKRKDGSIRVSYSVS